MSPRVYAIDASASGKERLYDRQESTGRFEVFDFFGVPILWFTKAQANAADVEMAKATATTMTRTDEPPMRVCERFDFRQWWQRAREGYQFVVVHG